MADAATSSPPDPVRVVLGEDQKLMREGLVLLMERAGFEVVGLAGDGEDLVRKARAHRPDVVVTDIRMPPSQTDEGLKAALEIRGELPGMGVVLLSQHVQRRFVTELLESGNGEGGFAYLLKQRVADADSFCADVRRVRAGGTVFDPEVISEVLSKSRRDPLSGLTSRQREVLALMAEGLSNAGIAERLVLSEKAVSKHVSHIYDELGLTPAPDSHRRVLAVMRHLDA